MPCRAVIRTSSAFCTRVRIQDIFPCEILYLAGSEVIYVIGNVFEIDGLERTSRIKILEKHIRYVL